MLTHSTPIPTMARGQVRALVKAHPEWPAFLTNEKHIISADARNADLIEFALRHPALTARIEQILGLHQAAPVKIAVAAYTVKIEALLSAYARRMASKAAPALPEPSPQPTTSGLKKRTSKARKATAAALNDFNYVGSPHHY